MANSLISATSITRSGGAEAEGAEPISDRFRLGDFERAADDVGWIGTVAHNVGQADGPKIPGTEHSKQVTIADLRQQAREALWHMAKSCGERHTELLLEGLGLSFVRYRHELPRLRHIYRVRQPLQQSGTPHLVEHHRRRILGIRHLDPPSRMGRIGEDDVAPALSLPSAPHIIAGARIAPHALRWSKPPRRSGPPEKVFEEFWKPLRGRFGVRRRGKVLDHH